MIGLSGLGTAVSSHYVDWCIWRVPAVVQFSRIHRDGSLGT